MRFGSLKCIVEQRVRPERSTTGIGANTHSVLCDRLKRDQFLVNQHSDGIDHDLFQQISMSGAKIRQSVVVHRDPAAEPHVGNIASCKIGDPAAARESFESCQQP